MHKKSLLISALLLGAFALSGCNDDTDTVKLTADQQLRLAEIKSQERIEMARIQSARQQQQVVTQPPVSQQQVTYSEDSSYPVSDLPSSGAGNSDNSSGSGVGSHLLAAGVGAVGGYYAGKSASTPQGQQRIQESKRKAYTGYRFAKSKATSKYRSFKKRK